MKIKISADSICDLPPELIAKYGIGIVPLSIVKGGQPFRDMVEITPQDIFDYVESGAGSCHTTAVNVSEYAELFAEYLKEYDAVIHTTISSVISCCHQNALIAAADLPNVYVIDSLNLSSGSGQLVLDAAIMAERGSPADEIAERVNQLAKYVESSFVIDTLKYLHKGGRCSGLAALGANLLKLKPCIEVTDGKMDVGKKYRGNFDKVILQYVADKLQGRDDIDPRRIFVTYAPGTPQEVVDSVTDAIRALGYFQEILTSLAGCTISNHCGPVCLGLLYYRKQG
ncbi:MAG: DegV family protein [Oscillospiraceae bacterium]|jgi:DegV family protein with EDD domain|nr:DegV family protein [Oscillospiraceae bacterium]